MSKDKQNFHVRGIDNFVMETIAESAKSLRWSRNTAILSILEDWAINARAKKKPQKKVPRNLAVSK